MNRRSIGMLGLRCPSRSIDGAASAAAGSAQPPPNRPAAGQLPPEAETTKNPLTGGRQSCSRPARPSSRKSARSATARAGKGDGPDADPDAQEDMDLTRAEARREESRRRDVLQGVERPQEAEDAGAQGRPDEGAGLGGRGLRADAAQDHDAVVAARPVTASA